MPEMSIGIDVGTRFHFIDANGVHHDTATIAGRYRIDPGGYVDTDTEYGGMSIDNSYGGCRALSFRTNRNEVYPDRFVPFWKINGYGVDPFIGKYPFFSRIRDTGGYEVTAQLGMLGIDMAIVTYCTGSEFILGDISLYPYGQINTSDHTQGNRFCYGAQVRLTCRADSGYEGSEVEHTLTLPLQPGAQGQSVSYPERWNSYRNSNQRCQLTLRVYTNEAQTTYEDYVCHIGDGHEMIFGTWMYYQMQSGGYLPYSWFSFQFST